MGLFDSIGHAFKKAGETVEKGVTEATHAAAGAAQTVAKTTTETFNEAVKGAGDSFNAAKGEISKLVEAGEDAVLRNKAAQEVGEYSDIIGDLVKVWPTVASRFASELAELRTAASSREMTAGAKQAMIEVATSSEIAPILERAASKSIASFAIEFGGGAALVIGGEGAIGAAIGLPNMTDVAGYGSVGVSIGASEGASGDVAIGLNTSAPKDSGGAYLSVSVEADIGVGGGVVVSYNLPDLSFGGFMIPVSAGEEINVSVGGGYTFMF